MTKYAKGTSMSDTTGCFYEIPSKSTITRQLEAVIDNGGGWILRKGFQAKQVDHRVLLEDGFFGWLSQKRTFVAAVLKMEPFTVYGWHVDDDRVCGINLLLSGWDSCCLFHRQHISDLVNSVTELVYQPGTYYAFNTDIPHTIFNRGVPRHLLSVQFCEPVTYAELLADLSEWGAT